MFASVSWTALLGVSSSRVDCPEVMMDVRLLPVCLPAHWWLLVLSSSLHSDWWCSRAMWMEPHFGLPNAWGCPKPSARHPWSREILVVFVGGTQLLPTRRLCLRFQVQIFFVRQCTWWLKEYTLRASDCGTLCSCFHVQLFEFNSRYYWVRIYNEKKYWIYFIRNWYLY